jgi:hypothetical protein
VGNLSGLIAELSTKQMTRKQFLAVIAGSFFGISGLFRYLQVINTPDLASSNKDVFGEREYGHVEGTPHATKEYSYNSGDVFG